MNIRHILAALLCALTLGSARAGTQMVDGEPCVVPDPSYVHVGVHDVDRYVWWWCATRFDRYWTIHLDPLARAGDVVIDMSPQARAAGSAGFVISGPVPRVELGDPATVDLERAARAAKDADTRRPAIPAWRVQTNGKSATRPGYVISDGKRSSAAATERVPVGVACGCREKADRTVEGKSVYCVVPGLKTTDLGALCTPGDATAVVPEPPKPPRPPVPPPVLTPPTTSPPTTGGNTPGVRP